MADNVAQAKTEDYDGDWRRYKMRRPHRLRGWWPFNMFDKMQVEDLKLAEDPDRAYLALWLS